MQATSVCERPSKLLNVTFIVLQFSMSLLVMNLRKVLIFSSRDFKYVFRWSKQHEKQWTLHFYFVRGMGEEGHGVQSQFFHFLTVFYMG